MRIDIVSAVCYLQNCGSLEIHILKRSKTLPKQKVSLLLEESFLNQIRVLAAKKRKSLSAFLAELVHEGFKSYKHEGEVSLEDFEKIKGIVSYVGDSLEESEKIWNG